MPSVLGDHEQVFADLPEQVAFARALLDAILVGPHKRKKYGIEKFLEVKYLCMGGIDR